MDIIYLIYLVCFGVGLVFTLISALAADVFGGHDFHTEAGGDLGGHAGHAEAGFGSHDMPGFSPLSPTTLATFVTAFGGLGLLFSRIRLTSSPWISAPLALFGALGLAFLVVVMFQQIFRRTQGSSEAQVADLIGQSATIITPIPENGVGEIAYVQAGSRYTAPARADGNPQLPQGQPVVITRISGTQFYVQPV